VPISFTHAVTGPLKETCDGTASTADRSSADRDTSSRKDVPMKRLHPMMKALPALILLALLLAPAVAAAAPAAHVVTDITPMPATPNVLKAGQKIHLSFRYVSSEPAGVTIRVEPMTGGKRAAGSSARVSPVYSAGSGTATSWFKITKGDVTVDRIRIQMWNTDEEPVRLQQIVIPVHYRFTKAKANVVHGLTMTPTPNVLHHKQKVSVKFKYRTNQRAGVRILVRPLTGKALTPRSAAHASRLYKGSGSGSGWFTVTGGTPAIDKVRVQMWNRAKTKRLFNAVVPVHYRYRMPTNVVDSIEFGIPSPNVLRLDQDLEVRFRYTTDHEDGVWIFVRPMTNGERTPNYAVSPPSLHPYRAGIGTGHFTIKSEAAEVDEIDITMMTPDLTTMLFRARIPVSFRFM